MNARRCSTMTLLAMALALVLITVDATAQPRSGRRGGLWGDWKVKMNFGERTMESIIAFSRDSERNLTGRWISFWGVNELKNVRFEEGQLSFEQEFPGREGQTITSKFKGTIEDGKLSGTVSSEMGEVQLEGERAPRMPRAVGTWAMKLKMGEREINTSLVISADEEGNVKVEWPSDRVQHEISDVSYERGRLTFKTKSQMGEREWESTFEGTVRGNELTGVIQSERGERPMEGERVGAAAIGTWNLEIEGERGPRKQRLRIHPDLSALYGAYPLEKVTLEDGKLTFKIVMEFGERTFETSFEGTIQDSKLTGELTTSRGTRKVTGTKVERRRRSRTL